MRRRYTELCCPASLSPESSQSNARASPRLIAPFHGIYQPQAFRLHCHRADQMGYIDATSRNTSQRQIYFEQHLKSWALTPINLATPPDDGRPV
jgi:hypothetical protein